MDENYWKRAYSQTWGVAAAREKALAEFVKDETGLEVVPCGMGTGTDAFIDGSAARNGFTKGDADLSIPAHNVFIEVTGPLLDRVPVASPLWIRPDKIKNAISNIANGHKTFIVHHCPSANLWRVIAINNSFVDMYRFKNEFPLVFPIIRGNAEKYVSIDARHRCIHPIEYMINYLKTLNPTFHSCMEMGTDNTNSSSPGDVLSKT